MWTKKIWGVATIKNMEDDIFQGDLQDYLENGDLNRRCYFQWCLTQALATDNHLLLEMQFANDIIADHYLNTELAHQTTRILERAVMAVIKGAEIKSICFNKETTIEDVQRTIS